MPSKKQERHFVASVKEFAEFGSPKQQNEFVPFLPPPRMGVYALYYILTKLGIISECSSQWEMQQNIKAIDAQMQATHKKRIEEMKKALDAERESERWSATTKFFMWMGSILSIFAGIVLIATGMGAIAGGLLIASGVISLTNHLLEITGGWRKIAAAIATNGTPEKKAA